MNFFHLFTLIMALLSYSLAGYCQIITVTMGNSCSADVYYEIKGQGKPMVILHRATSGYLEPIFEEQDEWKRIYIDPPGIGNSSANECIRNADDCLKVILAAIDILAPNEPFSLIGFSYFGYMARGIQAKTPNRVNGMALICPVVIPQNSGRTLPTNTKQFVDQEFYNRLPNDKKQQLENLVVKTPCSLQAVEKLKRDDVLMNVEFWNRIKLNGYSFSFDMDSVTFNNPALVLLGLQDDVVGFTDALRLSQAMPSASIVALDFASHSLPYEQNHLMRIHIFEWLKRVRYQIDYKEKTTH